MKEIIEELYKSCQNPNEEHCAQLQIANIHWSKILHPAAYVHTEVVNMGTSLSRNKIKYVRKVHNNLRHYLFLDLTRFLSLYLRKKHIHKYALCEHIYGLNYFTIITIQNLIYFLYQYNSNQNISISLPKQIPALSILY